MVCGHWSIQSKLDAVVRRRLDWGSRLSLRCVDAPFDALMRRLLMSLWDQDYLVEPNRRRKVPIRLVFQATLR